MRCKAAKQYLSYFTGVAVDWSCGDQDRLRHLVPENRSRVYDVRAVIDAMFDRASVLELRRGWAPGIVTSLARVEGRPLGVVANDPAHLGGAIDVDGADKGARFLQLCDAFDLPVLFLCDTPGFMVGPEHEARAAVRHVTRLFVTGANLTVPFGTIVLRKGYGLGAQAMAGGSFKAPEFCVSWPTGEFGGMNLEGAVRLSHARELAAISDPEERERAFRSMVERQYEAGAAMNVAMHFEIDDVIDPAESRTWIRTLLIGRDARSPRPEEAAEPRHLVSTSTPISGRGSRRTTPACTSSARSRSSSSRSARVWSPGSAGGDGADAAVRENRGAGAGCTTPSTVTNVPRARLCGWFGASASPRTGDAAGLGCDELGFPFGSGLLPEPRRHRVAVCGPGLGGVLLRNGDAETLAQLRVELWLHRPDREVLTVGGLVRAVVVRGAVEHVGVPAVLPATFREQAVEDRHQRGGTVEHRDVDDLPDARAACVDDAAQEPDREQHAAAAVVADQVERRDRRLFGPDRVQGTRERQVVDVVPGHLGVRTILAPAGHPRVHETRSAVEQVGGPDPEAFGRTGPVHVDERVSTRGQRVDDLPPTRVLHVDGDRPLAPTHERVDGRGLIDLGRLDPRAPRRHRGLRATSRRTARGPDPPSSRCGCRRVARSSLRPSPARRGGLLGGVRDDLVAVLDLDGGEQIGRVRVDLERALGHLDAER